jgi:BNR repeat-containing family member
MLPDAGSLPVLGEPTMLDIAPVWAGHPVQFALVSAGEWQYAAYYDAERRMTVAARRLAEDTWSYQVLPSSVGWDSHNAIAMAVDGAGHVHVSGNMHNVPLIYFRTREPWDASTLEQVESMVGRNEDSATYPEFFRGPEGTLVFAYRDGGSGNGNHIFNSYDSEAQSWARLLDTPLTDGEGQRNAYPVGPVQGPDHLWHLVWVWRDSPDASTNHDISYAKTADLVQWQTGTGDPLALPIRLSTGDIVDPVPTGAGMINNNTKVGFDADDRPIVGYHKYDAEGNTQLFNARLEDGEWIVHQTSDWDYRWEFGGNGTLVFPIELGGVEAHPDGTLTQTWYHAEYGGWGAFRLDPETLRAVEEIDPPLPYPAELDVPVSDFAGIHVRWARDWNEETSAQMRYLLRWETLDSNRDMEQSPVPPASALRLYGFPKP